MATLVELAKRGIITKEMEFCAEYEKRPVDYIVEGLVEGTIVIPANIFHREREDFTPRAIGKGLKTKVNANIGTSGDIEDIELELEKLRVAVKYGADAVMDLSTGKFI
ncbi:MAG: phosphomethylpyrimidine synthase, partial [Thermovibrio sp.]